MIQRIYHTKKYAVIGALLSFFWMAVVTTLVEDDMLTRFPVLQKLESMLNLSLLIALALFLIAFTLIFRKRPLLQGSQRGLYLCVSRKNRGVVPWRHISHFECSADRHKILIYLQGAWDVPADCGERFDIRFGDGGRRVIVLPLHRKAGNVVRVCAVLEKWRVQFVTVPGMVSPDQYEPDQRRNAAMSARSSGALLLPLYFIRSKFWFLAAIMYLLMAGGVEYLTALSRPWVLGISALPALAVIIVLRRLLPKAIRALEQHKEKNNIRHIGL